MISLDGVMLGEHASLNGADTSAVKAPRYHPPPLSICDV
jgi:hypothetical protein